jgi:hypothetical protein
VNEHFKENSQRLKVHLIITACLKSLVDFAKTSSRSKLTYCKSDWPKYYLGQEFPTFYKWRTTWTSKIVSRIDKEAFFLLACQQITFFIVLVNKPTFFK